MTQFIRRNIVRLVAAAAVLVCWAVVAPPGMSSAARAGLASGFSFVRSPISPADPYGTRLRPVAPAYRDIQAWISSVGAGVALADLDGNGRSDDSCLVDPRDNSVTVAPVPGTGARFAPLRLDPAPALPYDATMAPMGCVPADYNADGLVDVLVYYWGRSPVIFMREPGAGMLFAARETVQPYQVWNTDAVTVADVDGDGHDDLVVGNYFRDGARVLDPADRSDPDLQMQDSMSRAYNGGTDRVLLFDGATGGAAPAVHYTPTDGVFPPDVAGGSWTLAIAAADLNGDGRPEIYLANDFGPDRLLLNRSTPGHPRFTEVKGSRGANTPKSKVLGNDSFKGMGVAFTDLDADGRPDILVSNITEPYALQESNFAFVTGGREPIDRAGTGSGYVDRSTELGLAWSGWSWDVKAPDLNGDGVPEVLQATGFVQGTTNRWPQLQELAMSNDELLHRPGVWPRVRPGDDLSGHDPDRLFARGSDGTYHDIAAQLGVNDRNPSRGIAVADVDHDGRLDFAVADQWAQSSYFHNTGPLAGNYLGLKLEQPTGCTGTTGTRTSAIGASVTLDRPAGGVRIGQVYPANGHDGVSSDELYFGLPHDNAATATVTWRDQCGVRHTGRLTVAAGWHTLLLNPSGAIEEVRP